MYALACLYSRKRDGHSGAVDRARAPHKSCHFATVPQSNRRKQSVLLFGHPFPPPPLPRRPKTTLQRIYVRNVALTHKLHNSSRWYSHDLVEMLGRWALRKIDRVRTVIIATNANVSIARASRMCRYWLMCIGARAPQTLQTRPSAQAKLFRSHLKMSRADALKCHRMCLGYWACYIDTSLHTLTYAHRHTRARTQSTVICVPFARARARSLTRIHMHTRTRKGARARTPNS